MVTINYSSCNNLKEFYELALRELAIAHGDEYLIYLQVIPGYLKKCSSYRELGTNQGGSAAAALFENLEYYELIDISFKLYNNSKHLFDGYIASNQLQVALHEGDSLSANTNKETDFLLVDSKHSYAHVTRELQRFAPVTKKYIMIHDTTLQPAVYKAVQDFIAQNDDWVEVEHCVLNVGYAVIEHI